MSKLLIVIETNVNYEPIVSVQNLQASILKTQDLPEGVEVISKTAFLVEFPKCALFFAKLLVFLERDRLNYQLFEVVTPTN